jgi:ataxia telangiectasia mutated family protein
MDYRGVPRTVEFLPSFSITENGISRPKIISCLGSDGRWRKQLVKGGDDMRQDAVMEQVFEAVNHMLGRDDEAAKRALGVRTYKIVPTTPQTGVLQWVENTLPFGAILYDKERGTHNRYYSAELGRGGSVNDAEWSHGQCREHLKDAADNADKLRKFHEVMDHFHPSLRFFFLERYADPARWMASRLAYTRSVAVTSMVGYILGIGDRHAHNILVDTLTAEVVHIDFGIVYEQGKGLGAPETVPFRLTRDIVDGMGVTGVEGTFRRSCEEVLRVLRDNALQIMTILEVVIHDPLYKWSLSPLQARMKQNTVPDFQLNLASKATPQLQNTAVGTTTKQGGSFGKDAAERTLMRIKNKLHGYEDPTGEALSVEGLVDLLINEARSPGNLCRLFPGWAPWL